MTAPARRLIDPVRQLAPLLHFDSAEPLLPELVAVTVFTADGPSPSFPATVEVQGDVAVEYALWWPCEIGHVYELEHVWVHGRRQGGRYPVTTVVGSAHGGRRTLDVTFDAGRPVVLLEPGKHGTAAAVDQFAMPHDVIEWLCGSGAGRGGVCVTPLFTDHLLPTPVQHRQARRYLRQFAFTPSWQFTTVVDVAELSAMSFEELAPSVPDRVFGQLAGVSSAPLRRRAGGLGDDSPVAVVRIDATDTGLVADGRPFSEVLGQVRAEQRELVVFLDSLPANAVDEVVATLRRNWCVTATALVCRTAAQLTAVRQAGATAVADRRAGQFALDDDWVHTALDVTDRFRVLGPAGDIEYPG